MIRGRWTLLFVLVSGCADRGAEPPVRRSDLSQWTVNPRPQVEIGAGEGDDALYQVTSAVRLADGRIVVLNAGTRQVRFFSAQGKHQLNLGRAGHGPGEFQFPSWVGMHADSVLVWDAGLERLSVIDANGRFVRSAAPLSSAGMFPAVVGQYPGGLVLASGIDPGAAGASRGKPWRPRVALMRITWQGVVRDTLARVPGTERYAWTSPDGRGTTVQDLPLGRRTVTAAYGNRMYVGTAESYRIVSIDSAGVAHEFIREARTPQKVTSADILDYRARVVTVGGRGREQDRSTPDVPRAGELPPYDDLVADARGNVWVKQPQLPRAWDDPDTWIIYSPSGRALASIELPARVRLLQAGEDYILVTAIDDQQRELVRVYQYGPS